MLPAGPDRRHPSERMQAPNTHDGDEGAPPDGDVPAGDFHLIGVTPAATVDASGLDPGPVLLMVRNAVARIDEGAVLEVTGGDDGLGDELSRSEERRVGKECRSRW